MKTTVMKRRLSLFVAVIMALTLQAAVPLGASAADGVTYIDADGNKQTRSGVTEITSGSDPALGSGGAETWYSVSGNVEISSRITVTGAVYLILADGCDFTASRGINVVSGNSLTVYAQSIGEDMGKLTVTSDGTQAGIGGSSEDDGGTITINGGEVNAQGQNGGAGIGGGGDGGDGGMVSINGGTVTATGIYGGAGIGGGLEGNGGTVEITGGTVKATGGVYGAGIGGGLEGNGGTVTISGGTVTAIDGGDGSKGIGRGADGNSDGTLDITNAIVFANSVTATDGDQGRKNAILVIDDGATTFYDADGETTDGTVTLNSDYVIPATKALTIPAGITLNLASGSIVNNGAITNNGTIINGGAITNSGAIANYGAIVNNGAITGSPIYGSGTITENDVPYIDAGGGSETKDDVIVITSYADTLNDGWYIVYGEVNIGTRITVTGDVHLILANGCDFAVRKGINVAGESNSLTVYGQSGGTGKLTAGGAESDYGYAGIGGGNQQVGGSVLINGGTVTATGGTGGAGIGGGGFGYCTGGEVTINGGKVDAQGGYSGAGIGGGNGGAGGTITISGGTVTANGDRRSAGIGGGGGGYDPGGAGGTITITGGTVDAQGGYGDDGTGGGAGIGGGGGTAGGAGGIVSITGGTVDAQGSDDGSGIGGGSAYQEPYDKGAGGTLDIKDVIVFASSATEGTTGADAILVTDSGTTFYDNTVTLNGDYVIPSAKTLTVPNNKTLNLASGSLTVNGTLADEGTGSLEGGGTLTNNGSVAVSLASVTVNGTYTYTGSAIIPDLTVKIMGTTLTNDIDFTVNASNNTDAGTASYTVTGNGNYTGIKSGTFTIVKAPDPTYALTVTGGSGSGSFTAGTPVSITANAAPFGKMFDAWESSGGGSFANASSATTTFIMPANAVMVTATYKNAPAPDPDDETGIPPYKADDERAPAEQDGGGIIVPHIPDEAPRDALIVTGDGGVIPSYAIAEEFPRDSVELDGQKNSFPSLALVAKDNTTVYLESKDADAAFDFSAWIDSWADFFAYSDATYLGRYYIEADENGRPYFTGGDLARLTYGGHELALFAVDGSKEAYGTWQNEPPDEAVRFGWAYENRAWYFYIDEDVQTGWLYWERNWYLLDDTDGHMLVGWQYDHGSWYYLAGNGKMLANKWAKDGGIWYYLGGNGAMRIGWAKVGGSWYYLRGDGAMLWGRWLHDIDGSWYYLAESGKMLTGKRNIGGKVYSFKADGVWIGLNRAYYAVAIRGCAEMCGFD